MNCFLPREQENDSSHPLSLPDTSSTLAKDTIHQEFGILFPTPPRPMTIVDFFETPVANILGPAQTAPIIPSPTAVTVTDMGSQPSPTQAGTQQPLQNATVPEFSNHWSASPSEPPSPTTPDPGTDPAYVHDAHLHYMNTHHPSWEPPRTLPPFVPPPAGHPNPTGQYQHQGPHPFQYRSPPGFPTHYHTRPTYFPPFQPNTSTGMYNLGSTPVPGQSSPIYVTTREPPKFKLPKD